jgi:hypothetical protein
MSTIIETYEMSSIDGREHGNEGEESDVDESMFIVDDDTSSSFSDSGGRMEMCNETIIRSNHMCFKRQQTKNKPVINN